MGRIIANKVRGMNWMAKVSLVLIFTMVFSIFMYQGWYDPKQAAAAVTPLNAWPSTPTQTATTGNPTAAVYTVNAGNDRVLIVVVDCYDSGGSSGQTFTVTYGGQPVTQAVIENSNRRQSWIGYRALGNSASNTTGSLAVTVTGTHSNVAVRAASYSGVNQTTTITGSSSIYLNNTSSNSTIPAANVNAGGYGIYTWSSNQTRTSDNESYTEHGEVLAGVNTGVASKAIAATGTTSPTVTYAATARVSMSLVTLNPAVSDTTPPSVTINQAAGQADPTGSSPINYTVIFSESVSNFATGDVTISGTAGGTKTATVTGSGTTYNVAVTGMTTPGTVIATIAANVATDAAGNPNTASTSTDNTVTWDNVAPTVTINQAAGQVDPTNTSPINYAVVFSESVSNFATGDVTISGTAGGTKTATVTGSGTTYNVAVTGMTTPGTVIASIAAGVATDAAGNGNTASTSTDNTVNWDATPPSGLSATTPANGASDLPLNTTVNSTTATDTNGPVQYYFQVAEDAAFSVGVQNSGWQAGTSYAPTLAFSKTYFWHVKARDAIGNETAYTGTQSFSTIAQCIRSVPDVNLVPTNLNITTDGGTAVFTLQVLNNDTLTCSSSTFSLAAFDSNSTNFNASTVSAPSVTLAPGASSSGLTLTVHAKLGEISGQNLAYVTATDGTNHAAQPGTSNTTTTTLNVVQCIANKPLVVIAPDSENINANSQLFYTISVKNTDTGAGCPTVTYSVNIASETNTTDFNTSTRTPTTLALDKGASGTSTLRVSTKVGATIGAVNVTTISVTATGHVASDPVTATSTVGNTLLHNSVNIGSTKWAADGGWGVPGGKYGEFYCSTCHTSGDTNNIKRISGSITTPDPAKGTLPGDGQPIVFTKLSGNPGDPGVLGDDSDTPRTSSNRICEICHTYDATQTNGVNVHVYNSQGQNLGNHQNFNAKDCIACHKHNQGFLPTGCEGCHGNPPGTLASTPYTTGSATAGAHIAHSTTLGYTCENCHNGYVMPQESSVKPGFSDISIGFSNFGSTTGTYTGQSNVSYNNTLGTGTKTCSTVYCHGSTIGGPATPAVWDATAGSYSCASASNGACHGASSSTPPTLGSHTQHAGAGAGNYSMSCTICHTAVSSGAHVNGDVAWSISTTDARSNGGTYKGAASGATGGLAPSASYGSCATLYCHGNFGGNGNNASPTWGSSASGNCGTCHDVDTSPTMDGGSHDRHVHGGLSITCDYCHQGTAVNAAGGIQSTTQHANGSLEWNLLTTNSRVGAAGTYRGVASGIRTTALVGTLPYGSCASIYCHSNVQGIGGSGAPTSYGTPQWGGTVNCGDCHKAGPAGGTAEQDTGSHLKHASATQYHIACAQCHQGAGSGTTNHANAQVNVTINATWGGTYNGTAAPGDGYGSCSSVYCHSAGQSSTGGALGAGDYKTQAWGATLGCAGCHKNMDTDATAPGSHKQHAQDGGIACATCHAGYTETTVSTSTHVDKSINVAIEATYGGTYNGTTTPGDGYSTCSSSKCHGTTSPAWGTNTTDATCVKCHGIATSSSAQYTADPNRAAPGYTAAAAPTGPGRDTAGQTGTVTSNVSNDAQVGAHDTHLRSLGGYKTGGVACTDCHAVTNITDAGHMNGSSTMTWSNLAKNIGTVPYNADNGPITPGYTSPNCTTNYCHGGGFAAAVQGTGTTVSWVNGAYLANAGSVMNSTDCNRCHQSPPTSSAKYAHGGITLGAGACSGCHNHDGYGDSRHINGTLEASGGACNGCHGYGPSATDGKPERAIEGKGAHEKHVAHLVARWGGTLNPNTDQFGSGASWTNVCGVCHNGASHNMGEAIGGTGRTISIPTSYQFGASAPVYNGTVGVSSATTPKSCSNISCHYSTTPVWSAY